jgi:hypothetical protein
MATKRHEKHNRLNRQSGQTNWRKAVLVNRLRLGFLYFTLLRLKLACFASQERDQLDRGENSLRRLIAVTA